MMDARDQHIPETMYRASRYFRVLGNPTAYLIVRNLGKGTKTPSRLSVDVRRSLVTVSKTLRHLRQVDLVAYQTRGNEKHYSLKSKGILKVLDGAEGVADAMRVRH